MRLTKIVCTLGPATSSKAIQSRLINAGMDVARLNLSHGNFDDHLKTFKQIRILSNSLKKKVAVLFDLPGPKLRLKSPTENYLLEKNKEVSIYSGGREPKESLALNYPGIAPQIKKSTCILINDGRVKLKVTGIDKNEIKAKVIEGGPVKKGNGVILPGTGLNLPSVTEKDIKLAKDSAKAGADWIAQSFVKKAEDIAKLREALVAEGYNVPIMAKIEKKEAVDNLEEIIEVADGLMVARGDLGIEMLPEEVPLIQKKIIKLATQSGKPVVTATQMLESMVGSATPTRAEASDVANAIFDGTDAVMLSGETAIGKYPAESINVMRRIIEKTEKNIDYAAALEQKNNVATEITTDAISYASAELASGLKAKLIITSTETGNTALQVSKYRPSKPILAVTPSDKTCLKLKMVWGVYPVIIEASKNIDDMFEKAIEAAKKEKLIAKGQKAVITAGVIVNVPGTTNLIKVQEA